MLLVQRPARDKDWLHYTPVHPSFDVLGAETNSQARRQYEAMMEALNLIISNGHSKFRGPLPFRLSSEQLVDPRASFELACLYYQMGDLSKSESFCRKAIEDGKQLGAPYVIPQILLSFLLFERAEHGQALLRFGFGCPRRSDPQYFSRIDKAAEKLEHKIKCLGLPNAY